MTNEEKIEAPQTDHGAWRRGLITGFAIWGVVHLAFWAFA